MREKRAFEASLPAIDDAARLPERQAMIEAWEAQEWAEREDEIKGVQEERLALLENALMVRRVFCIITAVIQRHSSWVCNGVCRILQHHERDCCGM